MLARRTIRLVEGRIKCAQKATLTCHKKPGALRRGVYHAAEAAAHEGDREGAPVHGFEVGAQRILNLRKIGGERHIFLRQMSVPELDSTE